MPCVLTAWVIEHCTALIESLGYGGIFALMTGESMIFPIPSGAVMPFAGFLVADGRMSYALVVLVATAGSITGSLLGYTMGRYGGPALVRRCGRWLMLNEQHLASTEQFFARHGRTAVFVGRLLPVVRHLISIPAGVARMPLLPFALCTIAGATLWNGFLVWVGILLGQNWAKLKDYTFFVDIGVMLVVLGGLIWFWRSKARRPVPGKVASTSADQAGGG